MVISVRAQGWSMEGWLGVQLGFGLELESDPRGQDVQLCGLGMQGLR